MAVIQFRRPGRTDGQEQYDNGVDFDEEVLAEEPERNTAAETAGSARRSRGKRLLRTLLLAALFAAGAYLIYYVSSTRSYAGASYTKAADMITQEGTWYEALGGSVVSYSADGASCMDASGKSAWSITYEMHRRLQWQRNSCFEFTEGTLQNQHQHAAAGAVCIGWRRSGRGARGYKSYLDLSV